MSETGTYLDRLWAEIFLEVEVTNQSLLEVRINKKKFTSEHTLEQNCRKPSKINLKTDQKNSKWNYPHTNKTASVILTDFSRNTET